MDSPVINLTRFDAAYYKDNMTVLFHFEGSTSLWNESLMINIGVYAYGESRWGMTFDPCNANIASLCPANANVSIQAAGIIPVSTSDVANIPPIALTIPDFEGQAILRIFSNRTQSEVTCYTAVLTNGNSFSQPATVGTTLGLFTLVAVLASFATAIYGDHLPTMRTHYAHSLSVGVIFAVFQHIFFTGALSVNWPSVLVAWWSNFAWAAGMIHTSAMQASIDQFIGKNVGNTTLTGAADAGSTQSYLGGGFNPASIYKSAGNILNSRDLAYNIYSNDPFEVLKRANIGHRFEQALQRRALADSSDGSFWYGDLVSHGMPSPGNYSGFAGTLAQESIRASNASLTGTLWFLILLIIMVASVVAFKWIMEASVLVGVLRNNRFELFRKHWITYAVATALRICSIAFFMIMFLCMFDFYYQESAAPKVVAATIFLVFFVGAVLTVSYAYYYRFQSANRITKRSYSVPQTSGSFQSLVPDDHSYNISSYRLIRFFQRLAPLGREPRSIHEDEEYIQKFGWLAARFRRSRWWFFGAWFFYEFIRACFYAGAASHPFTQVFGILIVEIVSFGLMIWARPFEGQRLNALVVYLLGFSKVASVALSCAFHVSFNLGRIITTVIGIIIIVIQGILTIVTLIAVVIGAISSYMSISRDKETHEFRPKKWRRLRENYFEHLNRAACELPPPVKEKKLPVSTPELPNGPYFTVSSVRRIDKIEDEDKTFGVALRLDPALSVISLNAPSRVLSPTGEFFQGPRRVFSSSSIRSNLPFGARPHRPSWSMHDEDDDRSIRLVDMNQYVPEDAVVTSPTMSTASLPLHHDVPRVGLTIPKVHVARSMDNLRVGQNMDRSISDIPLPAFRPRAGTFNSRGPSRASS
ncbi:TRP-domain-containing protein, partial [Myriangium duriaei CBS 260.36]